MDDNLQSASSLGPATTAASFNFVVDPGFPPSWRPGALLLAWPVIRYVTAASSLLLCSSSVRLLASIHSPNSEQRCRILEADRYEIAENLRRRQ
jgi:hypothetical protein